MYVETQDWKPGSILDRPHLSTLALLAGALTGALGASFLGVFILADIGGAVDAFLEDPAEEQEEEVEEQEPVVMDAAFVQLGREFDPREMPDRQVATSSLAQRRPDPNAVSKRTVEPQEYPEEPPPPNAYEDTLDRLGNRAEFFESLVAAETEGDPDGTEEGRLDREGNAYLGYLVSLFKRGWQLPNTIPDSELVGLSAVVSFTITSDLRMQDLRLARGSGNADYDRSIRQRLDEVRHTQFRLRPPPEDQRDRFVGTPITLNMLPPTGLVREARRRLDRGGGASTSAQPASEERTEYDVGERLDRRAEPEETPAPDSESTTPTASPVEEPSADAPASPSGGSSDAPEAEEGAGGE